MHNRSTNLNLWRFTLKTDLDLINIYLHGNILTDNYKSIYLRMQITLKFINSISKIPISTPLFTNYAFANNRIKTNSVVDSLIHKYNNIATMRNGSNLTFIKFLRNNLILMGVIAIYLKQRYII